MSQSANVIVAKKAPPPPVKAVVKTLFVARNDFAVMLNSQYLTFSRGQLIEAGLAKRLQALSCSDVEEFDMETLLQCPHCGRIFPQERG